MGSTLLVVAFAGAGAQSLSAGSSRHEGLLPLAQAAPGFQIRWDKYHPYAELTAIAQYLAKQYPHLVSIESAGKTTMKKRDIWVLTLTNTRTGKPEDKPGFWLDGNTHASEVGGAETALYTAWYLATQHGKDLQATDLLDTRTFYIMPRKDIDGAEVFMTGVLDFDPAKVPFAADADGDGKIGEDGPDDVDGDGQIVQMRIADSNGQWTVSSKDSRIMVRRKPEDGGPFYRTMAEGKDDDGDGRVNEDSPRSRFSSNRNYPGRWSNEDGTQRGEGDYPLQEIETRITVEQIVAHQNIAGMQSLHHNAGAILRPFCNLTDDVYPHKDLAYYDAIAARGRQLTNYGYISVYNDFTGDKSQPRYGVQVDWGYLHLGELTFTTEQWRYAGNVGPRGPWREPTAEEQMARNDRDFGGKHFVNWHSFKHPQLGDVEIGGWVKYALSNAPPEVMEEEMLKPNMAFILYHASTTPLVRVADVKVTPVGGVQKIVATISNDGLLPTNVTEQAIRARIAKPVVAQIELGPGVSLVSGTKTVTMGHIEGTPAIVKEYENGFGTEVIGGNNRRTAEWVVSGSGQVTVTAISQKGGKHARTVTIAAPAPQPVKK
jgi:hypothetical protein